MSKGSKAWRVGFDVGGTFTDMVLYNGLEESLRLNKTLTTPDDPSVGALSGIKELLAKAGISFSDVDEIVHGTTLVTNAVIERKGARVALITTAGFADVIEMGTEQRYDIYDLFLAFPEPMVRRDFRFEVNERLDRDGNVVTALDEEEVRRVLQQAVDAGAEAFAICLINAYRNAAHEIAIERIARGMFPDIAISLSSRVDGSLSEYPRFITTCANAYVQPLINGYLWRLQSDLRALGFAGDLRLMHSAGGLVTVDTACAYPIRLLESGPAGGALATALFARSVGEQDVIAFDMGGTTAKACLIENGELQIAPLLEAARVKRFRKGSGLPMRAPVVDLIEIGAGGGSIASINEVGLLAVGPHSAGSKPGPASYGLGGDAPTVTDANVLLGYYDPDFFLGGQMKLDLEAAEKAMHRIADPLKMGVQEAAWGIHRVVVESMAAAARIHIVEKGKDPRNYSMVGFGGAGPTHAVEVARAIGVRHVIIPPASGAASALGFLAAPFSFENARSFPVELSEGFDAQGVNDLLAGLEAEGRRHVLAAGASPNELRVERGADMRLAGQMHEIFVPLPAGTLGADSVPEIRKAFLAAYSARYAQAPDDAVIEVMHFRLRVSGASPDLSIRGTTWGDGLADVGKKSRRAWFGNGWQTADVYNRYSLAEGQVIVGPAIIEERESTTVIPPGDSVTVDAERNLRITLRTSGAVTETITHDIPLEQAVARIEADPIALEVMWSRLITIVEEMWIAVHRTAFSLIVSESQDFATELFDADGQTLAHSPRSMPVFNLTLPRAVKELLKRFPAETLKPGDVLITNDPWICAGHLFDIAIVTPVFVEGRIVGLMGTIGHASDIGGTRDSMRAREIYEEGIQIPPMKLISAGVPNDTLFDLIAENVRTPRQVLGDLQAFIAANELGADNLKAFMAEYGMRNLRALSTVVQTRSENAMRTAIRALPDGEYRSTIWNNPMGEKLVYPIKLTVRGDEIEIDLEGAPPQLAQGGFNATLNYTMAHATYPLKCMLTPSVRGNAGCYRPFTVKAPEGSILNAKRPAAVSVRHRTGWYLAPNIFRALSQTAPDLVQANSGLPVLADIYGRDANGRAYSDILFIGGGQGASAHGDGQSTLLWPTSAASGSIELFESRVPLLVLMKALAADSGGEGMHRGGLGQRMLLRKLSDDGQVTLVSLFPEGVGNPIEGLFGGKPGAEPVARVIDDQGHEIRNAGAGALVELTDTMNLVEIVSGGGAGYGDPARRAAGKTERDLQLGFITHESKVTSNTSGSILQPDAVL